MPDPKPKARKRLKLPDSRDQRVEFPTAATTPPPTSIRVDEVTLGGEIGRRLIGPPSDGSTGTRDSQRLPRVIWTDAGDDVLVHLDSVRTKVLDRTIYVSVDLECDQTGRSPLVCVFAVGTAEDPSGLFAVTDELPKGNGLIASRWGEIIQDAIWAALLGIAEDIASTQKLQPIGISASVGAVQFHAGDSLVVQIPIRTAQ